MKYFKNFLEGLLFVVVMSFNTLLLVLLAFAICSSGFLFFIGYIQVGPCLGYNYDTGNIVVNIIFGVIIAIMFILGMILPAKLSEKIPNWIEIFEVI